MELIRRISLAVVAVATMAVTVSRPASAASQVPFRATLTEVNTGAAPCGSFLCLTVTGTGQATHLGAITESAGIVVDLSIVDPVTDCSPEIRTSTFTAANWANGKANGANGDQIKLQGPSVAVRNCLPFASPTWRDLWTVVSGTGRFAGATGSGTNTVSITRTTEKTTSVTTFTGTISY